MATITKDDDSGLSPIIPSSQRQSVRSQTAKVIRQQEKWRRRRRILYGVLACGALATLIFLIAMATTDWVRLDFPSGVYRKSSSAFVQRHISGLFRLCRSEIDNNTRPIVRREYCRMLSFFPSQRIIDEDNEIDSVILDYSRSGAAFAIIVLVIAAGANFFTWYSIQEPRYMFKRVAGSLHLITGGCVLVCVEVFRNSLHYAKSNLPGRFPTDAYLYYGVSFGLAWTSFALYIGVGIALFILSAKRKGERALSAMEAAENEPVHLGRI